MLDFLSDKELSVLLATKASEFSQSAKELAQNTETCDVTPELESLSDKGILHGHGGWTDEGLRDDRLDIVYSWGESDLAQLIADMLIPRTEYE